MATEDKPLSGKLLARAIKSKMAARQRVINRGILQFRLDAKSMEELLEIAERKKTGAGVLARLWVMERLEQEKLSKQAANNSSALIHFYISLPDTKTDEFLAQLQSLIKDTNVKKVKKLAK